MSRGMAELLSALSRTLDELRDFSWDGASDAELGAALIDMDRAGHRLRREQARVATRFDARGAAGIDGLPTTAAWLRSHTSASDGEASQLVQVGRALRDRLPATDRALANGAIGWAAAATIERSLRGVRDEKAVARADELLAASAHQLSARQLAFAARRVLQWVDPEAAQRDARQRHEDRCLSVAPLLDGAVALSGQLDEVGAAVLLSALAPLTTPLGPEDRRTAAQRRADALVELVGKAAQDGHAGTRNAAGLPPTVVVRVDVERLAAATGAAAAELDWGGPVLGDTLDRLGCSAQVIRVVTAGRSRVLDVGEAHRLAAPAQRLALAARDRGCRFPGCDRPPGWTDAHHVIPWRRGGQTDLANLVSLCRFHHRLVHEGGWSLSGHAEAWEFRDRSGVLRASAAEFRAGMERAP